MKTQAIGHGFQVDFPDNQPDAGCRFEDAKEFQRLGRLPAAESTNDKLLCQLALGRQAPARNKPLLGDELPDPLRDLIADLLAAYGRSH